MSNLLELASIILTPTAYSADTLHCIKPNTATGDFNFDRTTTSTRVNSSGNIEALSANLPRIDYTGGTGHISLEPQSTNLVTNSAGGTYGNNPASETLTTAPDTTNTAVRPVPDSTSDRYQYVIAGGSYLTNSKLTYSWYRKRISTPSDTSFVGDLEIKALQNCTQVGSTTQIQTNVNGFDRFQAVFNITDGSLQALIRGYFGKVVGIGNSSVAYWGHQIEPQEFATSLIPTTGTMVTRSLDAANGAGSSSLISGGSSGEGVIYAEIAAFTSNPGAANISLSDNSQTKRIVIGFGFSPNQFLCTINNGSNFPNFLSFQTVTDVTAYNKIALKYKLNDISLYINGVEVATDTSSTIPNMQSLQFDNGYNGANQFFGKVKCVAIYKTALTDSQLQCLTS